MSKCSTQLAALVCKLKLNCLSSSTKLSIVPKIYCYGLRSPLVARCRFSNKLNKFPQMWNLSRRGKWIDGLHICAPRHPNSLWQYFRYFTKFLVLSLSNTLRLLRTVQPTQILLYFGKGVKMDQNYTRQFE